MLVRSTLAVCLAMVVSIAHAATDRFFFDRDVKSADGRWRLTAISPDNAGPQPEPFADEFTYKLIDTTTGAAVWQRQQPANEMSPVDVFVSDEGWAVIRTAWDEILGLDPETGAVAVKVPILDELPKAEEREHVQHTTAGRRWDGASRCSFLRSDDESLFVVRTGWGRRVIVSLTARAVVREPTDELRASLDRADSAFALATLEAECERDPDEPDSEDRMERYRRYRDRQAALKIAADLEVREAVPLIQCLARSDEIGMSTGGYSEYSLRAACHCALRMLGVTPEERPLTLVYGMPEQPGKSKPPLLDGATRAQRAQTVTAGMSDVEVFELIGAPDSITLFTRTWEFDIDLDEPYTLQVRWKEGTRTVERLDRLTPPRWKTGDRAREVFEGQFIRD